MVDRRPRTRPALGTPVTRPPPSPPGCTRPVSLPSGPATPRSDCTASRSSRSTRRGAVTRRRTVCAAASPPSPRSAPTPGWRTCGACCRADSAACAGAATGALPAAAPGSASCTRTSRCRCHRSLSWPASSRASSRRAGPAVCAAPSHAPCTGCRTKRPQSRPCWTGSPDGTGTRRRASSRRAAGTSGRYEKTGISETDASRQAVLSAEMFQVMIDFKYDNSMFNQLFLYALWSYFELQLS